MFQPKYNGKYFIMYINYEENKKEQLNLNKNNYLSIDLGINNFCACTDTLGHSFLMNGKPIKSYNKWYNKKVAEVKSELKIKNNKNWSNYLQKIIIYRDNWIDNYFNQIVSKLITHCDRNNIGNIVVGYNEGWKTKINIGKINNQKFYFIPYLKFKIKLENKCNEFGINFIYHEESYTSKCSFIDLESMKKQEVYLGKRVKRGLFQTSKGILLNADINGSGNILRKVIGDAWISQPIVDLMLNPVKINFYKETLVS
jgi:IS605 OrfB family transposase